MCLIISIVALKKIKIKMDLTEIFNSYRESSKIEMIF